jgi:integrase
MRRPAQWQSDLSRAFRRHRTGRSGWYLEVANDRLRLRSTELPPRPGEPPDAPPKRRDLWLTTPPGPATAAAALAEACAVFDGVMAGTWRWPDPSAPAADDPGRLRPATLARLIARLRENVVGERIAAGTWERTYQPYLAQLEAVAGERTWPSDVELIAATLRHWPPNRRARQMAHDRIRRLWREAGWEWPAQLVELRGNGKAAASPDGVRAFTDAEITELRARIERSHLLTPADLVAWDLLIVFGLRPAELQGLEVSAQQGVPVAKVSRVKRSSKGTSGARTVPAVPPAGWPVDCFELVQRWRSHGLPEGMVAARSPGQRLTQQLRRLRTQAPATIALDPELTAYSARHAFALRLAQRIGLHVREAAELMGHSPAVHLQTYGRRLDSPALVRDVIGRVTGNR